MTAYVKLLRPGQWLKNAFVLAPLLFSGRATEPAMVLAALGAFAAFCLAASAVYALNDVRDAEEDRLHPTKRHRPVASGQVPATVALAAAGACAVGALALGWSIRPAVAAWIAGYFALNLAYTFGWKQIVLLDVFCIAIFFIMRLLTGAAAVGVHSSVWLLTCGGLLSLYLGFAKRRHELAVLGTGAASHRGVLAHYSAPLLDQISSILLSVTIVAYLMYTLNSEAARRLGNEQLSYGTIFVLFGVFRYLYLVHQHAQGTPTDAIVEDRPLQLTVLLWIAYSAWLIYRVPGVTA